MKGIVQRIGEFLIQHLDTLAALVEEMRTGP